MSERAQTGREPQALNPFIAIGADEKVTVTVNKSEMGQGVYTSLPMLVAEELECEWSQIRVEAAPVDAIYNHTVFGIQLTGGSTSVSSEWERLRKAGAAAREMLITAAASIWEADQSTCRAEKGKVIHQSGKMLTYGQLAARAAALPAPQEVPLKDPSAFKIIGRPLPRLDTPEKVTGKAVFGLDFKNDGALTAVVARSPVFGGKVKSFDAAKAKAVPGSRKWSRSNRGSPFWPPIFGRPTSGGALSKWSGTKARLPAFPPRACARITRAWPGRRAPWPVRKEAAMRPWPGRRK